MTTQQFTSRAARLGFSTFVPASASRDYYYQAHDIGNVVLMSPARAVGSALSEAPEVGAKGIPAQGEAGPVNNHACVVVHKKEESKYSPMACRMMRSVSVVIPTRNRPEKLERCLSALAKARALIAFEAYVGDSSDTASMRKAVQTVCEGFAFVHLHHHTGKNVAAARNFCAQMAPTELLVNVDDDVYVEPDAILRLFEAYHRGQGWRVVAGSVAWGEDWSRPGIKRLIGYCRKVQPGELPSFLIGAFFLYPRALALALPWNERIRRTDDIFMGALWRCKSVNLLFEPRARAFHDEQHNVDGVKDQESHIYANLFDALLANPNLPRALAYEFLGFAAGAKIYFRHPKTAWDYLAAWHRGHRALVRDWGYLKALVHRPLSEDRPPK